MSAPKIGHKNRLGHAKHTKLGQGNINQCNCGWLDPATIIYGHQCEDYISGKPTLAEQLLPC